jgi:predicted aspartyl protease
MPHIILPLTPDGPFIKASIGISAERKQALKIAEQAYPDPITVLALIDTGASSTCVDRRVIQRLSLALKGMTTIHTPSTAGTPMEAEEYDVSFGIADQHGEFKNVSTMPVIASHFDGFDVLLGRDVLEQMLFIYDGIAGQFTLAF